MLPILIWHDLRICVSFPCTIVEFVEADQGWRWWCKLSNIFDVIIVLATNVIPASWLDMIWESRYLLSLHGVDTLADLCILLWRQALYYIWGISLIPQRIVIGACDLQTPSDCTCFFCFGLQFSKVWVFLPMGIDNAVVRPFAVLRLFRVVKLGRLIRKYRRLKILWNLFQATGCKTMQKPSKTKGLRTATHALLQTYILLYDII